MKLLYGTTNQAKLNTMQAILAPLNITLIGLRDITAELPAVDETGSTPLENARQKAQAYYNTLRIPLFSCDSGLYFENLPPALQHYQPGTNVRNVNRKTIFLGTPQPDALSDTLTDKEMIEHYSNLAKKVGGKLIAYYQNAICFIPNDKELYEYMGQDIASHKFYLTDTPHQTQMQGFPLDSLSVHIESSQYYYDRKKMEQDDFYLEKGFVHFFKNALRV